MVLFFSKYSKNNNAVFTFSELSVKMSIMVLIVDLVVKT